MTVPVVREFLVVSMNSYLAQDNSGIVPVQSKNRDKVGIIQYGNQLLNVSFYFALFFNKPFIFFPSYSKRIFVSCVLRVCFIG